ncbi:MAG TPA: hypothetical protein VKS79_12275 [Gemmataceae bacterium]|nr:hypothetical protein [Gemmataceae bacterium]
MLKIEIATVAEPVASKLLVLLRKARRARRDPVAFAEFAFMDECGRRLRLPMVHRELQAFLTSAARGLVELPRDHGKTVQVMIRVIWELGRDPNLRVLVACGSGALAVQRGRFLRDAITLNPRVRLVFPHLVPDRPWQANAFRVRRPGNSVSPSVVVIGNGTSATGARADLLVCDDVVDVKSLRSETLREKTKQIFRENLVNLLEPGGRAWLLFTPWHAGDLNSELKDNPGYAHFRRAVGDDLEPVWPEKWPRERLAERRREIGESSFARAFRLRTLAEEDCLIRAEWVRFWEGEQLVARSGDRATTKSGDRATITDATFVEAVAGASPLTPIPSPPRGEGQTEDSSDDGEGRMVVLAVDPAVSKKRTADASALVTLVKAGGRVFCLEATARRVAAPELVQLIDDAERRWQPNVILFESNAAFKGIKDLITAHARFGSKVKEITHSSDKFARMHSFSVRVENGAFLLKGENGLVDAGQQALLDEMLAFPVGKHDDLVDAAAFGSAYLFDMREPRVF